MSPPHSPTSSNPSPKSSILKLRSHSVLTDPASPSASTSTSDLPTALPELKRSDSRQSPPWAAPGGDGRRTSVQFATRQDGGLRRPASPKPHPPPSRRRMSSPPPPSTYEDRVSFDTFQNRDATDLSFTLISKHKDYVHTARSRTFLCGADQNDYSEFALEWLVDELVEDGDEIVCLRVVDKDSKINSDASLQEEKYKTEARKFLDQIQAKNDEVKSISLILEFAVGRVQETIQRMINIYAPACLIVGTRGRSLGGIQGLLPGSVSKYCLQHSPIPVVVVRPSHKREKMKKKRLADPSRRTFQDIFDQSGRAGRQTLDKYQREKVLQQQSIGEASEREAAAVAAAIGVSSNNNTGLFANFREEKLRDERERRGDSEAAAALRRGSLGRSEYIAAREETPSPVGGLSPDEPLPGEKRSPEFEKLDSPAMSDDEPDDVDEGSDGKRGRGGKVTDVRAARKMEAGEGRYLKPGSSITEDP